MCPLIPNKEIKGLIMQIMVEELCLKLIHIKMSSISFAAGGLTDANPGGKGLQQGGSRAWT